MKPVISCVALAMVTLSVSACGVTSTCDCADPSLSVRVPAAMVQPSNQITLSGAACQGVTATCLQSSGNGCLIYNVRPAAPGNCHIDVALSDHTFTSDVTIKRTAGCCPGLYADPLGAGDVQVTSLR